VGLTLLPIMEESTQRCDSLDDPDQVFAAAPSRTRTNPEKAFLNSPTNEAPGTAGSLVVANRAGGQPTALTRPGTAGRNS
jgi:hypothetical protein